MQLHTYAEIMAQALAIWSGPLETVAWKSVVILAVIAAVMLLWRRGAAATRHLVWTTALCCLLCLPLFVWWVPGWRAPVWIVPSNLNSSTPTALEFVLESPTRPETRVASEAPQPTVPNVTKVSNAPTATARAGRVDRVLARLRSSAAALWLIGVGVGLVRLLAALVQLRRLAATMQACGNPGWLKFVNELRTEYRIRRHVRLLMCDASVTPMTWGFWRAVVALPAESVQWPDERLRLVLRHELAHVKRWDCLTQGIAHVVCALYWFNPLAWFAARRMRSEREKACDDLVLRVGARPSEYAGHLLEITRQFAGAPRVGTVAIVHTSGLEQRIRAILDAHRNRNGLASMTATLVMLAIGGLGLLVGGIRVEAADNPVQQEPASPVADTASISTATVQRSDDDRPLTGEPLAKGQLADGRILQVEGVTFGTNHQIGEESRVDGRFSPRFFHSEIRLERPALVVWVNAINPATGKYVDCQGIRVAFIDEQGELFGAADSHWSSGQFIDGPDGRTSFFRVGHVFYAFPRTQQKLTMQVTPWRTNESIRLEFSNPRLTVPAAWSGSPLPQQKRIGDMEVRLTELVMRTNGGPKQYWKTPSRYWEPLWELRQGGKTAAGWDPPEWVAEDPTGNRGQFLSVNQPVLRFSAAFYPSATNMEAALLLGRLPDAALTSVQSIVWWNRKFRLESNEVEVLGLFPAGMHIFSAGSYQTNPPPSMRMGPVVGGAPSGWVGRGVTPAQTEKVDWGHYTPSPVIYLRAPVLDANERLAVRLRDDQGRYWLTKPEPQGTKQGISPYLLQIPPDVKSVVAEIVVLRPVQAEFTVETEGARNR
jgi:beta-lactamase regulating signal transducer with metallopeptidase domain